ncbi:MAG: pyridoxal-phosphate dependent enzyme, partial [Gemmatimonadales bacterium]
NFELLHGRVDAVTVSDDAIIDATVWLHREVGLTVEPSGAATTAALRAEAIRPTGPTVLIVSGGNIDPAAVERLAGEGR